MNQRSIKRRFPEIRKEIMLSLSQGQKTVNKLANDSGINWKTVNNHLIYLMGSGLVNEVLSTPYVKIFELTENGRETINPFFSKNMRFEERKIPIKMQL